MWSIIHFLKDNSVATVPSKWYYRNKCAWPNHQSKRHIEDQTDPNSHNFTWFKARALSTNIESFSEANIKCKKALVSSDLSSVETEDNNQNPKKNKMKSKVIEHHKKKKSLILEYSVDPDIDNSDSGVTDDKMMKMPIYESSDDAIASTNTKILKVSPVKNKFQPSDHGKLVKSPEKNLKQSISSSISPSPNKMYSQKFLDKSPNKSVRKRLFMNIVESPKLKNNCKVTPVKSPRKKILDPRESPLVSNFIESPKLNNYFEEVTPVKSPRIKIFNSKDAPSVSHLTESPNLKNSSEITPIRSTRKGILNSRESPLVSVSVESSKLNKSTFEKNHTIMKTPVNKSSRKSMFNNSRDSTFISCPGGSTSVFKGKTILSDGQFKDFMLHNILVLKHNMRNLDEKITLLLEKTNTNNSSVHDNDNSELNFSNLDCLFPIQDITTLNDIEEQLAVDNKYNIFLKNKLMGLGGKTIKIFVKRIMQFLFTDHILKLYSFHGRANKKKCFSNLVISKVIFNSVKSFKKFQSESVNDEVEKYIKNALIQAPFNIKKKECVISSS